jgi:hypothetical protein
MKPTQSAVRTVLLLSTAAAGLSCGSSADAAINLELRPVFQSANVGATVSIGLYAVSDSSGNQGLASLQAIINWQPAYLQMLSNSNTGAIPMLSSAFTTPDPYGINESSVPQDGNAMYVGFANFGNPVLATPAGTLLTTLRFTALSQVGFTPVDIAVSGGSPNGFTRVFDSAVPNLNVTGTLSGAGVEVVPAPATGVVLSLIGLATLRRRR